MKLKLLCQLSILTRKTARAVSSPFFRQIFQETCRNSELYQDYGAELERKMGKLEEKSDLLTSLVK